MRYAIGQLVCIAIDNNPGDFATAFSFNALEHHLYEKIDMSSYPSCNDFFGKQTKVKNGDIASILNDRGIPPRMLRWPDNEFYRVYEILVNGSICNAFKKDMAPRAGS